MRATPPCIALEMSMSDEHVTTDRLLAEAIIQQSRDLGGVLGELRSELEQGRKESAHREDRWHNLVAEVRKKPDVPKTWYGALFGTREGLKAAFVAVMFAALLVTVIVLSLRTYPGDALAKDPEGQLAAPAAVYHIVPAAPPGSQNVDPGRSTMTGGAGRIETLQANELGVRVK